VHLVKVGSSLERLVPEAFQAAVQGGRILKRRLGILNKETLGAKANRWGLQDCGPVNWRQTVERAEKREFVTELNEVFKASGSVVVAHYAGVTVAQMNDFRSKMRAAGGTVKVAKNRLAKIALQGTESEGIVDLFKGQTLIAYSNDPITAPKVVMDFAKTNDKVVVLGGAMGSTTLDAEAVKSLATLPSLDELRAKLLGMIQTPATRIAGVVAAPASQLARVFAAYAKKDEAA
jgi:large subunit ribosomal protein L10